MEQLKFIEIRFLKNTPEDLEPDKILNDAWSLYSCDNNVYHAQDAFEKIVPYIESVKTHVETHSSLQGLDIKVNKFQTLANKYTIATYTNIRGTQFYYFVEAFHAVYQNNMHDDPVNPKHYRKGNIEVIDIIGTYTEDLKGIEATDTGNIIKYILRWKNKNGLEDLKKAKWYLEHLIGQLEGGNEYEN